MSNINFPTGATAGQVYTFDTSTWVFNGDAWVVSTNASAIGPTGPAGVAGANGATGPAASLAAGTASGTILTFIEDRVYGTITTPETGSISADITGGLLGVTNIVIHNSTSSPTFSAVFKKLTGSGFYATSQINYIYSTYIDSTNIIYSINQVI